MVVKNSSFYCGHAVVKDTKFLPSTGQTQCYDASGRIIPCVGTGQDGEFHFGQEWPKPRFKVFDEFVIDCLTDLCWFKKADLTGGLVTWSEAFEAVATLNLNSKEEVLWRLPNINELESLVDCNVRSPALPCRASIQRRSRGLLVVDNKHVRT